MRKRICVVVACLVVSACGTPRPTTVAPQPPTAMPVVRVSDVERRIRLTVVCDDSALRATVERAFRRGLRSQTFVDFVADDADIGIGVALEAGPDGSPSSQTVAISLCVVAGCPLEAPDTADKLEPHRLVLQDLKICTRTELVATCEELAERVTDQFLSPLQLRLEEDDALRDALRAGETDLIDVDWIKRKER